ncbi:MAG: hypothetical protein IID18_01240, partial [Nitrospinae bacterium]|nr:hypothetical protein [Nitrospinota bacterium]
VLGVSIDFLIGVTEEPELKDMLQHEEVFEFFRSYKDLPQDAKETIEKHIKFLKSQDDSESL